MNVILQSRSGFYLFGFRTFFFSFAQVRWKVTDATQAGPVWDLHVVKLGLLLNLKIKHRTLTVPLLSYFFDKHSNLITKRGSEVA
jgi:hypothetical protein